MKMMNSRYAMKMMNGNKGKKPKYTPSHRLPLDRKLLRWCIQKAAPAELYGWTLDDDVHQPFTQASHYRTEIIGDAGGRTRLPKFKFSANFPIGLQVIL